MRYKEWLRHYWHEFYYKVATTSAENFAMDCKHVVEQIEVSDFPLTWRNWFRVKLHLSLCQACSYYFSASRSLCKAVRNMAKKSSGSVDIEKLNRELLKKYARTENE